jgi:hypothetical protein
MRVLVACEESQVVCKAFRERGHEAYSCDVLPCSGGHPEWHIQGDVLEVINGIIIDKKTGEYIADGNHRLSTKWDIMIAHPPCTRLANSGVRWLKERNLWRDLDYAVGFFAQIHEAPINKIAIENPIPHKYAREGFRYEHGATLNWIGGIGKYDQIIQPWQFGHGETKATCLWLKNLPKLEPTNIVEGREQRIHKMPPGADRAKERSKTFPGIAKAMAEQWG